MTTKQTLVAVAALSAAVGLGSPAAAQSIIKNPGDHPDYKFELEPHLLFGWANLYANNGFGAGVRMGLPIMHNGFISSINNSIAISFGIDWLRYSGCYYNGRVFNRRDDFGCGASFFLFPVAMQWNFWLTPRWSVFGEPGLYIHHGVYDDPCEELGLRNCSAPTRTGLGFAAYAGGRFHFNDTVALTMRLGYPTLSIGVSFLF
jgi:hypothetical protein